MREIVAVAAPAAIGSYSQAIETGSAVYISGQLPIDAATGGIPATVEEQTRQSLCNIRFILEASGLKMENIAKTTVYMQDLADFNKMNSVYEEFFKKPFPARAAFQVAALPRKALVEIEAVAVSSAGNEPQKSTKDKMMTGARKIMTACMNVQKNERVLIITDPATSFSVSETLFAAALECGALPLILYIEMPDKPGDDPNVIAQEAMRNVDVILTPTSKTLFHCPSVKAALATGARLGALSEGDEELLVRGAIEADFKALKPRLDVIDKKFTDGKSIHFTTPGGTNLTANIAGRKAFSNNCIIHQKGDAQGVPDLEVYIAPVEGSANGQIVIDASCSTIGLIKDQPIVITVEKGIAVKIEGGVEAEKLRKTLAASESPNVYNLAEMAVGMNPCGRLRGRIIEDESIYGTCHCALGTNANFGGTVKAPVHIDMVQWKPTIEIDGEMIFQNGAMIV